MALIFSRSRERARRRKALFLRIFRWVVLTGLFLGIGYSSYETGLALAEIQVNRLRDQLSVVTRERDQARDAGHQAQAALAQAREQIASLRTRYQADVPQGDMAGLVQRLHERIQEGVPPARLDQAVRATRAVTACEGTVDSKRIAIRTTPRSRAIDSASFMDGLISVYVTRDAAAADGQELTAHFRQVPDEETVASGSSPVRQAIVIGNVAFHFVVTLGDRRGFAVIAMNTCGR